MKEAAGRASRAMEPRVGFFGFWTGRVGGWTRGEAGKDSWEASNEAEGRWKRQSGLNRSAVEGNRASHRDTSARAPEGT